MLSNAAVKAALPRARAYKLHDAGGLHLIVRPSGSKTFRMKFRRKCKEQLVTLGPWPSLSLIEARARRDTYREQLDRGVDIKVNAAAAEACTFEQLARRWHDRRSPRWSPEHAADVLASLERDVFPSIGGIAPRAIDAQDVLELLLKVEERGRIESARRLRERVSGVFRFGIASQICSADPAALISDELSPRPVQRPQPALTHVESLRELLDVTDQAQAPAIAKLASRFLALTAVRLGALRGARWDEMGGIPDLHASIAGENASPGCDSASGECSLPVWRVPAERMKLTKVRKADPAAAHVIPLSVQAVDVLRAAWKISAGGELVFPGRRRGRPIGEGAIGDLYDTAGFAGRHVPHGWRASFSTILNERFPEDRGLIDQALAHVAHKGRVEAAYNRAQHQERMRDLYQGWADLISPR